MPTSRPTRASRSSPSRRERSADDCGDDGGHQQGDGGRRSCRRASVIGRALPLQPGVVEVTGVAQLRASARGSSWRRRPTGSRAGRPAAARRRRGPPRRADGVAVARQRPQAGPVSRPADLAAMRAPGAGRPTTVNGRTAVTSVSAHLVSTAWIAGHGRSIVRITLTSRTPLVDDHHAGARTIAQHASAISPSHGSEQQLPVARPARTTITAVAAQISAMNTRQRAAEPRPEHLAGSSGTPPSWHPRSRAERNQLVNTPVRARGPGRRSLEVAHLDVDFWVNGTWYPAVIGADVRPPRRRGAGDRRRVRLRQVDDRDGDDGPAAEERVTSAARSRSATASSSASTSARLRRSAAARSR